MINTGAASKRPIQEQLCCGNADLAFEVCDLIKGVGTAVDHGTEDKVKLSTSLLRFCLEQGGHAKAAN